jgi:ammonia channel protein AmtB
MSRKKKNEITSYQLFFFVIFAFLAVGIAVALIERGRVIAVILVILLALNFALYRIGGKTWQQQMNSTH